MATSDVRAQARYYAAGVVARFPIYTLAARPSDAEPAGYLAAVQIDDPQTFHDQRPIEHQALGHRRSEEELGWLVEHRRAHLYKRDGEAIGSRSLAVTASGR